MMTDPTTHADYVLRKNGYFYRPGSAGYTASVREAGRYTGSEAHAHAANAEGVTAHHISEFEPEPTHTPDLDEAGLEAAAARLCDEWGYFWDGDPHDSQTAPEDDEPYDERPSKGLFRKGAKAAVSAYLRAAPAGEPVADPSVIAASLGVLIRDWMTGPNPLADDKLERVIERRLARYASPPAPTELLRRALLSSPCPYPVRGSGVEIVAECIARGQCGCDNKPALSAGGNDDQR